MIKKKTNKKTIEIDLTGPEGNAFFLLGSAQRWAKQCGMDSEKIIEEMTDGDYEHLLLTIDKYFGSIVTFYR